MNRSKGDLLADKVIHERVRLLVLTSLASSEEPEMTFKELQKLLETTAGNLSVQLRTLEKSGYVAIKKEFIGNKPQTSVSLTSQGRSALESYLSEMELLLKGMRAKKSKKDSAETKSKGAYDGNP
ncbi:MAG: winged helix-turn-helix domain-containing protein [Chitinispirillaceae bacterium]